VSPPGAAARVAPQRVVAVRPVEGARVGAPRPEVAQVVVAQQGAALAPLEGAAVAQQAGAPWVLQAAVRLSWGAGVEAAGAE